MACQTETTRKRWTEWTYIPPNLLEIITHTHTSWAFGIDGPLASNRISPTSCDHAPLVPATSSYQVPPWIFTNWANLSPKRLTLVNLRAILLGGLKKWESTSWKDRINIMQWIISKSSSQVTRRYIRKFLRCSPMHHWCKNDFHTASGFFSWN